MKGRFRVILMVAIMIFVIVSCIVLYLKSLFALENKRASLIKVPEVMRNSDVQKLESEITEIKTMIATESVANKKPQIIIKDEFSFILIEVISLNKKLNLGGEISDEIFKLKTHSVKFSELQKIISLFENVKILLSRSALLGEFNEYAKTVKANEFAKLDGFFNKILSKITKYITILSKNNAQDRVLIEIESNIQNGDFVSAFNLSSKIDFEGKFESNLKNSALVEEGIKEIYLFIAKALNTSSKETL